MKNHKECPEREHGIPNWDWPVFRPKRMSLGLGMRKKSAVHAGFFSIQVTTQM